MKLFYIAIAALFLNRSEPINVSGQAAISVIGNHPINILGTDSTMYNLTQMGVPTNKAITQFVDTTFTNVLVFVAANYSVSPVAKSVSSTDTSHWNTIYRTALVGTGTSGQYFRGNGTLATFPSIPAAQVNTDWNSGSGVNQLLNKPTIPTNLSQLTNDVGYITGITGSMVINALEYTPYNNSNPSGYISTVTSINVITALGYTPVPGTRILTIANTSFDLSANRTWSPSTTDISEGANLYYTTTRVRSAISLTTTGSGGSTYNSSTGALNIPVPAVIDTTSLSARINLKMNYTDTVGLSNRINVNSTNITTNATKLPKIYNASGLLNITPKVWADIITPTTGSGQIVDISSAGFSTILDVQAQAANNTSTIASMPLVSIKSYTTSQVVLNIIQSNSNIISILTGLVFATSFTGMTVHVIVFGY